MFTYSRLGNRRMKNKTEDGNFSGIDYPRLKNKQRIKKADTVLRDYFSNGVTN